MAQMAVPKKVVLFRRLTPATPEIAGRTTHLAWFAGMTLLAFLIPFVFTSLLDLPHDLYYLAYFGATLAGLRAYVGATKTDVAGLFRRNWKLSLLLGLAASAFLVWNVLSREDSTPRPDGAYFVFEVAWRGAAYGLVDALLLSAFPAAVAYGVMKGVVDGPGRRLAFAGLTLGLVLVITGIYHLGYSQFREDGIVGPETGNTVISVPAIASMNPLGSLVAHTSMHVTASVHAYETETFLPPQTDAD